MNLIKFFLPVFLFAWSTSSINLNDSKRSKSIRLKLISTFDLDVPEPSGLENFSKKNQFLTVSDNSNRIYSISKRGSRIKEFPYKGNDLEGIAFDSIGGRIFVVEEKKLEVVELNLEGIETNRFPVYIDVEDENHGLEGIAYNYENKHLYVINEKAPSLLMEITTEGELLNSYPLSFAWDYSSIYYEAISNTLWILSDESRILANCDLQGNLIQKYKTRINEGTGVVVEPKNRLIYIASDYEEKLYVFKY